MTINTKIQCFDYLITSLIKQCYNSATSGSEKEVIAVSCSNSNLSKLKLMKLLFFVTVVNVDNWYLLDNVFNNFYAMPYGPVESDVYDNLNLLENYYLIDNQIRVKDSANFNYSLDQKIKDIIDLSIKTLKGINPNIFNMRAFELVELSHKADSWRITFNEALCSGNLSRLIPIEVIKLSRVYFN